MSHAVEEVDYPHLPGEEHNPLMESPLHQRWGTMLISALTYTVREAHPANLVTGNVRLSGVPGVKATAPDVMVIPNCTSPEFKSYRIGADGPAPTACIEILSTSNTTALINGRAERWLRAGVGEVYVLDPETETIEQLTMVDDEIRRTDARGHHSDALNVTFAIIDDRLMLCCPAGRLVGRDSDSLAWLADEQRRADREKARADEEKARADDEKARADELARRVEELSRRLELGDR